MIPTQKKDDSDWLMVVDLSYTGSPTVYWWPKFQRSFRYEADEVIVNTEKIYGWVDSGQVNFAIHKDLLR